MEEILKGLLLSLREFNQKLSEIDEDLSSTQKELGDFEGEYAREIKTIQDSIEYLNVQIDSTIKAEIKKLPTPKDGKDFDEKLLKQLFETKFKELTQQRNIETDKIQKEIIDLVSEIPIPKDGIDGKDAKEINYDEVQSFVFDWLDSHKDDLKGDTGERGINGLNGRDGSDGISIVDVTIKSDVMTIHFSDDTTKEIKLPKQKVMMGGGGISNEALQDATNELIISTNIDLELTAKNQTVLVDAISGDINITLPNPINCFIRGRSNRIAITKIDNSANTVNIIPFDSEFILSENSQELLQRHEILNFITDSTNWYLGA